jgi:acetyl esterase/lipase
VLWFALSVVVVGVVAGVGVQLWKGLPRERPAWWSPKRILQLDLAMLDQLTLLQYARLAPSLLASRRRLGARLGVAFGTHGLRLDAFASASQGSPLVLFAFGGGWGSGSRLLYGLLARTLTERGCAVVIPDYRLPPDVLIADMLDDLREALSWARENGRELGANPERLHLIGHSAGAHLWALLLVRARIAGDRALLNGVGSLTALSGIYDIEAHYQHEHSRGVEAVSAMHGVMGETEESFATASPLLLVGQPMPEGRVPPITLLHGAEDSTVPASSSERFHEALARAGWPSTYARLEGAGHLDPLVDVMRPGRWTETLLQALEAIWR